MAYYPPPGYPLPEYYPDKSAEEVPMDKQGIPEAALYDEQQLYGSHSLHCGPTHLPQMDVSYLSYHQVSPYKCQQQLPPYKHVDQPPSYACTPQPVLSYYKPMEAGEVKAQQSQLSQQKASTPSEAAPPHMGGVSTGKKKQGNLPKESTAILKRWLQQHTANPYPTEDEKMELSALTKLTVQQVSNWFINARRRYLPTIQKEKGETIESCALMRRSKKRSRASPAQEVLQEAAQGEAMEASLEEAQDATQGEAQATAIAKICADENNTYLKTEMNDSGTFATSEEQYFGGSFECDNTNEDDWNKSELNEAAHSGGEVMKVLDQPLSNQDIVSDHQNNVYEFHTEPVILESSNNFGGMSGSNMLHSSAFSHILVGETPPSTPPTSFQTVLQFVPTESDPIPHPVVPQIDYQFGHEYQIPYSMSHTTLFSGADQNIYEQQAHVEIPEYDMEDESAGISKYSSNEQQSSGLKILANVALDTNHENSLPTPSPVECDQTADDIAESSTTRILLSL